MGIETMHFVMFSDWLKKHQALRCMMSRVSGDILLHISYTSYSYLGPIEITTVLG